jgi:ssDNA-binding Zn-finger/Zn-ribbon topoisomerase 1
MRRYPYVYKQQVRLYVKRIGQRRCEDWSNHQNNLKKEDQMTRDTDNGKTNILDIFDKIFIKHLERLIGSNYLTNKLTLNSLIISCLILLMERENEIKSVSSGVSIRYTYETLMSELEEMDFGPNREDMNIVIRDMIENGYITVDDDKKFIPGKPSAIMVKLLDQAFPDMPGMNLIAYFIQTVDEVKSERKDLATAKSQFDQVLTMRGVLLDKEQPDPAPTKIPEQSEDQKPRIKKSGILGRQKVDSWHNASKSSLFDSKVLSSAAYEGKLRKLDFGKPSLDEHKTKNISDIDEQSKSERPKDRVKGGETNPYDDVEKQSDMQNLLEEVAAKNIPVDDSTSPIETPLQDMEPAEQDKYPLIKNKDEESETDSTVNKVTEAKEAIDDKPDKRSEKEDLIKIDDDIEKRITAFEEDLALECPICKQSKIQAEETAMGKTFYRCLSKNCNFISWGKPYHILCPICNNPFLVEAFDKAGKTILKCPRSTCRYRQNLPWEASENNKEKIHSVFQESNKVTPISRKPRKRVKKRRVVRRKK